MKWKFTPIIRLKALVPNTDKLNTKYLYYALNTVKIWSKNWWIPNINATDVKKIEISVPPLEQQEAIVYVLDNFDKLANDLTEWLPAEIKLRQQQYEYYRDKLLDFSSEARFERERERVK